MSDNYNEKSGSSFWQLMLAIPGSIIAFTLIIALIANYFGVKTDAELAEPQAVAETEAVVEEAAEEVAMEEEEDDFSDMEDEEDMDDEGAVVAAAATGAAKSGEEVYKSVCMMCHASGMMESPKFGDATAWEARIEQGLDTLVDHAINGYNMMPAKGGNSSLSDEEVASAVKYMANSAGAEF